MEILKFKPLLKSTIWGGSKIVPFKNLSSEQTNVGESWEVSGVKDNESVVAQGKYEGRNLNQLVEELKEKLVGRENYERFGNTFPLLVKFIDAQQDLSIQVHPDDETAHRQGKPMGKTEMWYALDSDADATLRVGLKKTITPETYKTMVEEKGLAAELICEFEYVLLTSKDSPIAKENDPSEEFLADYTEITHADPYVPSLPLAEVKKEEISDVSARMVFVFERASQFELLSNNPFTYMWVSPIAPDQLSRLGLVLKRCKGNKRRVYRDILISKKEYKYTATDKKFIEKLHEERDRLQALYGDEQTAEPMSAQE